MIKLMENFSISHSGGRSCKWRFSLGLTIVVGPTSLPGSRLYGVCDVWTVEETRASAVTWALTAATTLASLGKIPPSLTRAPLKLN